MGWILIILTYVAPMCDGNNSSASGVPGFHSAAACKQAEAEIRKLDNGSPCRVIQTACVMDFK